jgi:tetratricopeptide (TPR) repeat protein
MNENAEVAVEKALALNPDLADGHFARGIILWTHAKRFPHEQAIQSFKRAIALDPNLDEAHHRLGMVYSHIGLLNDALREVRKALEINPNNTMARFREGTIDAYQGNYEEAVAIFKKVPPDFSPSLINRNMADALFHLGRYSEASAVVEDYLKTYPQDEGGNITSVKAMLLAREGRQREAEETIRRAIEVGQGFGHFHHTAYNIASAYAMLNKPDEAVKWLQDAADDGFPCYTFFEIDHNLDNIRSTPQFIALMARLKPQWERYKAEYSTN